VIEVGKCAEGTVFNLQIGQKSHRDDVCIYRNLMEPMRYILPLLILTCAVAANAQPRTFKWTTELCEVTGTYNSKKYTAAQLRDTLKLFGASSPRIDFQATVWKHEEIAKLDITALDREYEQKSKMIRELNIVKVPFWENLRQATLKEMQQYYELSKVTAGAYTQPEVIKAYPSAESCKLKYAGPLVAGGERLVAAWREVNLASQKVNADPGRLQQQFDRENASPDRLKLALVETMSFGWWNCANEFIESPKQASDGTAEKEFRKLFIRMRERCDEP
jgi:hypothetical protein